MDPLPPDYNQVEIEVAPPSYSGPSFASESARTTAGQPTEHIYYLTGDFNDKPWATLKLMIAAHSPDDLPVLFEGEWLYLYTYTVFNNMGRCLTYRDIRPRRREC